MIAPPAFPFSLIAKCEDQKTSLGSQNVTNAYSLNWQILNCVNPLTMINVGIKDMEKVSYSCCYSILYILSAKISAAKGTLDCYSVNLGVFRVSNHVLISPVQCLSKENALYAQKYLLPLSLDPTLEARILRERTFGAKKKQQQQQAKPNQPLASRWEKGPF